MSSTFPASLVMDPPARRRLASAETFDEIARKAEVLAGRCDAETARFLRRCAAALDVAAASVAAEEKYEAQIHRLRRELARAKKAENAAVERATRKREWLKLRAGIRKDRLFRGRPERDWNSEADRRLVAWLNERGVGVSEKTIANQRGRENWLG